MRHNVSLEGPAFRLRPINDDDAEFVIQLRTRTQRSRFLHPISRRVKNQLAWLAKYYERPGDYYFVIEHVDTREAEGLISLYDVDVQAGCAQWGRWILKPHSRAEVESVWLLYRFAFRQLGLNRIYCRTVKKNLAMVSFHDSFGGHNRRKIPNYFNFGGKLLDAIEHTLERTTWEDIERYLDHFVYLAAERTLRHRPKRKRSK